MGPGRIQLASRQSDPQFTNRRPETFPHHLFKSLLITCSIFIFSLSLLIIFTYLHSVVLSICHNKMETYVDGIESNDTALFSSELDNNNLAKKLVVDDLRFVERLGSGDIGTVYLVELKGSFFAAKVMDREELAYRSKEGRAGIEREILGMLDHPFLPSLYAALDCPRWSCLLTEFCPGGDLHVLRQRQPEKRFDEDASRLVFSLLMNISL